MRLPLGDLAENNKENVRVFAEYFSKMSQQPEEDCRKCHQRHNPTQSHEGTR